MKKLLFFAIIALAILSVIGVLYKKQNPSTNSPTTRASYACKDGNSIDVEFFTGESKSPVAPDMPPTPRGSVHLKLSDGRDMTLTQTLSASGVRYANADESFVFWNKGNGALVLENNVEKSFIGCIETAINPGTLPKVYSNSEYGFSIRYPENFKVEENYIYGNLGPHKEIYGVKFVIDPNIATSTNLSQDSYVSVEEIPETNLCDASLFLSLPKGQTPVSLDENGTTYSFASTTGAGAGNRYEEQVFVLPGTRPCVAVRYYVHTTAVENYPEGTVSLYNRAALLATFNSIRKTLNLVQ